MRISRAKLLLLIAMSLVGIAASSYIFYVFDTLHSQLLLCSSSARIFGVTVDCETVLSSRYNNVLGVNLDLLAIAYFFVNLGLVFAVALGSESVFAEAFRVLFVWRFLGIIIVPYLMTIEFVVLKAICIYCTIMHFAIIIDFAVVTYFLFWQDITEAGRSGSRSEVALPEGSAPGLGGGS